MSRAYFEQICTILLSYLAKCERLSPSSENSLSRASRSKQAQLDYTELMVVTIYSLSGSMREI